MESALERGADVEHRKNGIVFINGWDFKNPTVLTCASMKGHLRVVECLLSRRCDIDATDDWYGWTSLHAASRNGHSSVVSALIHAGGAVNKRTIGSDGEWTPLHYSATYNHPSCVRILLQNGGDATAKDTHGRTPFYYACNEAVKAVFREFGINQ